ncbi:GST1 [Symbiodinium pilosum]|uniref:GST1 protein n=1 Tax=Symbiodinium pilosum TaxID=2952 RepID=A0A812QRH5_SYMPI|nr:GST1 [Symbiodinium pilosum]
MPSLRLHWWDAPGRAGEPTRLALTVKGVPFEDVRYSFGEKERAEATRAKSPYRQFPILEVDGEAVAQSNTILRYVGRLTGLLPEDPLAAARLEAIMDFLAMDVEPLALCNHLQGEEKLAARVAAAAEGSAFRKRLGQLDAAIAPLMGQEVNMAHLKVFCETSAFISGFYDGFPANDTLFDGCDNIKALRKQIANMDAVKAYYEGKGGLYAAFAPSSL